MSDDQARVREYLARLDGACDQIISWVFSHGTMFQFPRVVEYCAKENGGSGWEDSYQNRLIGRLCESQWFAKSDKSSNIYRCTVDDSIWYRDVDEWRMLAYKERLSCSSIPKTSDNLPVIGASLIDHQVFFSPDFFRTVSFDPTDAQRIDLDFFVRFLTELQDGSFKALMSNVQTVEKEKTVSIWNRLTNAFKGR